MSDMKIRLVCAACVAYGCKAGELQSELRTTEAERKHHEMIAGCLRTDLEYMTRERAEARAKCAEAVQEINRLMVLVGEEGIAKERAEARLAEYERALIAIRDGDPHDHLRGNAAKWPCIIAKDALALPAPPATGGE